VVQALDADRLLARTLLEAGSHSGTDDNMEVDYLDIEDSQPEESLGDNEGEEDEIDGEEVVIPSPPPTATKKRKRSKNRLKESSIGALW